MKYSEFLSLPVSDDLLLTSVQSFLESKIEKSNEFIEKLSDMMNDQETREIIDVSNYNLSYEINNRVVSLDPNEFASHFRNDDDEYDTVIDGVTITVNVDDVLEQLSNSVKVNRITTEALSVLKDSGDENPSSILTSFTSRIGLKVGDVSDNIQTMASSYVDIIATKGVGVGDRVRSILRYIGLYNASTDPEVPDIGIPSSELTDITGANVFQAWWSGAPKSILEFKDWLVDTVKKLLQLLEGVLQVVVGSNVYRTIKKFFTTLSLQADSFAYNSGGEDGNSIGDYGFTAKVNKLTLNYPWFYGSDTILSLANTIINFLKTEPGTPYQDIYTALYYICNKLYIQDYDDLDQGKITSLTLHNVLGSSPIPVWLSVNDFSTIGGCAKYLYKIFACKVSGWQADAQSDPVGYIYNCLNYVLNTFLDYYHINDVLGITDHLYSNNYTRIDLPGSSLFFWLVGNDIYYTRRVSPLASYKDYASLSDIYDSIKKSYGISWTLNVPVILNIDVQKISAYFDQLRSISDAYVETDKQMINAVYAANVADAFYLAILNRIDATGISFNQEIPQLSGYLAFSSAFTNAFKALTGRSRSDWVSTFGSLDNVDVSNSTLADALGSKFDNITYDATGDIMGVFRPLFKAMKDDDSFFPFAHIADIPIGRYHIITDYELGHIFTVFIEIVIVVIATIYVLKVASKLKKKALMLSTKADSVAWKQVENGTYDLNAARVQYKLQKKARRCQMLSGAIFGSLSKAVSFASSSIVNATSATIGSFRTKLVGANGQGETNTDTLHDAVVGIQSTNGNVNRVIGLITGNNL